MRNTRGAFAHGRLMQKEEKIAGELKVTSETWSIRLHTDRE